MNRVNRGLTSAGAGKIPRLKFYYRNWRGEFGYRTVEGQPLFWYGESPYHKEEQWFIKAYDTDKKDFRDFAVTDIIEFIKEI